MTKKRDKKTKKRNVPDSSNTISIDGSIARHGFTSRGRTHLGGSLMESFSNWAISPPDTRHRSTSHQSTIHWSLRHQSIFTRHQSSVCKYRIPGTGHQALYYLSLVIQSPVVGLQSSYPASISSHHSRTSERDYPVMTKWALNTHSHMSYQTQPHPAE